MTKKPDGRIITKIPDQRPLLMDTSIFSEGYPRSGGDAAEAHPRLINLREVQSSIAQPNGLAGSSKKRKRSSPKRRRKPRS